MPARGVERRLNLWLERQILDTASSNDDARERLSRTNASSDPGFRAELPNRRVRTYLVTGTLHRS